MKVVVQRVSAASVEVNGKISGKIGPGLLLLIGIHRNDCEADLNFVADKCVNLRIFEDDAGKMNRSLLEVKGEVLAVSQFTLLGNTRKGRRPSFIEAAPPEKAQLFYNRFVDKLTSYGVRVACGIFGAMMDVKLVNQGPVTLIVESMMKQE